jgi:tripartite-type tricarboxylate transporter receptor subunit TctC
MRTRLLAAMAGVASFLLAPSLAYAQADAAQFFKGKTVTYIVSAGAGGGYDTYGRLLTRYMAKHLPGTRFIVKNVPGAGHIVGANTIYASRPDGLTIGTFVTGLIYAQLLKTSGVNFDLGKMSWVGQMAEEGRNLIVATNSHVAAVDDLWKQRQPILLASSGIGSSNHIEGRIMIYALDLNARIVPNMQENETELSMIRGEVVGVLGSASSFSDFVRNGHGKFLLSIAGDRSEVEGAADIAPYVKRADARPLLALIATMAEIGRITAGPPNIPPARLNLLRRVFDKAVHDPGLLADAARIHVPITPSSGEVVDSKVKTLLAQSGSTVALLKKAKADK